MCSMTKIMKSTSDYYQKLMELKQKIQEVECIVIGAGAGLSTSSGFHYDQERFQTHFSDFEEIYGFHDMYTGGFYPFQSQEEYWAYWSRLIYINRYMDPLIPVYDNLYDLVKDKDYFVITTNVDHCFQKAGFDKQRLFYTQGDYGLFQCSEPCCQETFDNREIIFKMMHQQRNRQIPSELLPTCPYCGKPLTMWLRSDEYFVEDVGWHEAANRYKTFLKTRQHQKMLFLELGVGYHTPGIIKYPFLKLTSQYEQATYACINQGEAECPMHIKQRSICITSDIGRVLSDIKKHDR